MAESQPVEVLPAPLPPEIARDTYIVIAAFNEGKAIGDVVRELRVHYPNVVVTDDGSRDDTRERAHAAGATVLRHVINRGQGAALQTGIKYALKEGARFVVTFDADGQHRPEDIPGLVMPIARGEVEFCLGSRFLEHAKEVPFGRRMLLAAAVIFTRITSGMRLSDAHNGFRALSRRAAERIDLHLDRMAHASEIIDQLRASALPYREVPVLIRYTAYSMAKGQRSSAALRVAFDYLMERVLR
jgi:glycosyltransferase involved in cell wall biosynthesis